MFHLKQYLKQIIVPAFCIALLSCKDSSSSKAGEAANNQTASSQEAAPAIAADPALGNITLPSFQMQDAKGNAVDLASFKGKTILVNLWASWCPPCRREMPSLRNLYKAANPATTAFFMVALDDDFMKSLNWLNGQSLDVPDYYPTSQLPELFNVQGIPATFIFDASGKLIKKVEGAEDYDVEAYRKLFGAKG